MTDTRISVSFLAEHGPELGHTFALLSEYFNHRGGVLSNKFNEDSAALAVVHSLRSYAVTANSSSARHLLSELDWLLEYADEGGLKAFCDSASVGPENDDTNYRAIFQRMQQTLCERLGVARTLAATQ